MHTCVCVRVHSELIQPTAIGSIVVVTATKIPSPNLADSPSFPVISFCACMYAECLCAFVCVCVCPYKPPLRIQCAELTERKETRKDGECVRERGRGNRNKLLCWPIFSNPATRQFSGTDVPPHPRVPETLRCEIQPQLTDRMDGSGSDCVSRTPCISGWCFYLFVCAAASMCGRICNDLF